ncbi:MAG: AI-2E family transporter [Clostridia bacterium]|nr:AI-2E family transporter [Clostridia bacterium]
MKKDKRNVKKWLYWFSLALILIIVYKVLDSFSAIGDWFSKLFSVLAPFVVGVIIAYVLYTPVKKLEKLIGKNKYLKKRAKGISIFLVYVVLITFLVMAIKFLIPPLVESFRDLVNNSQSYYVDLRNRMDGLPEDSFLRSQSFKETLSSLNNIKIEDLISIEKITIYAQGILSFASGVFDVFVAFIVSIYLLLERREIVKFFKGFVESSFSKEVYQGIRKYFNKSSEIFCNFLAGQIFDAFVVGILTAIAMSMMGIKYAVMLGIFIGLFNLIPYFGAIIAVVISVFITLITGGLPQAIEMAIVVIILQQIDANIINPKIVGDSVKISPLLVIFSVTIGGAYFGVMGMFLAVPIAALIKLILDDIIEMNYAKKQEIGQNNKVEEIDLED